MIVPVIEIFAADIYRYGGSRCFCFHSDDGNWYEFHVPIAWGYYKEPSLYLESVNNRTAVHKFTWDEAIEFVSKLEFDNERFTQLVEVVANRGKFPNN